MQSHEASEAFDLAQGDYKKIATRIVANQQILLETTSSNFIESIDIASNGPTVKLFKDASKPPNLIRPSSLNYKITIKEAVNDFVEAELKCKDNEFIDVELEQHKVPLGLLGNNEEDLDDSMYPLT